MFRALSHRNFRLFLSGAFLSNTGTWMQSVAQGWLVLQITNSGAWLGFDNFMATAPGVLLTLVAGVIADKVDRKRLLMVTQAGAGLSALTLCALLWTDTIHWRGDVRRASDVWMILALTFVTGLCWAISGPSYQAITVDLVEREDIANAIALHSSQFQLARVVGPTLAAVTIQLFGLPGCFLANGLSYVAIVFALSRVKFKRRDEALTVVDVNPDGDAADEARAGRSIWAELADGIRYARGRPRVRAILLCSTVVCLFATPYMVLMPLFVKNVYGWGETGLSLMMGTAGAGALTGALALAYLGDMKRKGLFLLGTLFGGGSCVVAFASAPRAWMAVPMLYGIGVSLVCFFALGNTLLQQLVRDEMRGRVMSMWLLTFIGTMPVSSVISGASADRFGPRPTLTACGLVVLLFAFTVASRNPSLREI
jgi:MFS family permease